MVSRPTGRPRGRPKKASEIASERREKRQAGRPTLPFKEDPDRFLVALIDATMILNGWSERRASIEIAALQVGRPLTESEIDQLWPGARLAAPDGWMLAAYGPPIDSFGGANGRLPSNTRGGSRAGTIEGRAATLRQKAREWESDISAKRWRVAMSTAIGAAIKPTPEMRTATGFAERRALISGFVAAADEPRSTADHLIAMAAHTIGVRSLPDFSGI